LKERYALQALSLQLMWKMGGGGWVQYLDENKQLILAILDNQNLGKLNECATYQAKLQQNLMYLAAIADAQPQSVQNSSQAGPAPSMQPAQQYLQQQQLMMSQRTSIPPYLQQGPHVLPHLSQHSYHSQQGMVSSENAEMHLMSTDNDPQSMGGLSDYGKPPGSMDRNQTMGIGGGLAGSSPLGHPGRDGGTVQQGGGDESEVSYLKGSEDDGP
jgi:hypothetical protein